MLAAREETFGPVAPLIPFDEEEEALRLANATPYGLAAYFYTRDVSRVFRIAERLEYGIVGANDALRSREERNAAERTRARRGSCRGLEKIPTRHFRFG